MLLTIKDFRFGGGYDSIAEDGIYDTIDNVQVRYQFLLLQIISKEEAGFLFI